MRSAFLGLVLVAALGSAGCGNSPPTLAGGKPVRHWVEELRSPDVRQRRKAVAKLGNVGPADPEVLPALRTALDDREPAVRAEAVLAVGKYGPAAGELAAKLDTLRARDPDPRVRHYAEKTLEKVRPAP